MPHVFSPLPQRGEGSGKGPAVQPATRRASRACPHPQPLSRRRERGAKPTGALALWDHPHAPCFSPLSRSPGEGSGERARRFNLRSVAHHALALTPQPLSRRREREQACRNAGLLRTIHVPHVFSPLPQRGRGGRGEGPAVQLAIRRASRACPHPQPLSRRREGEQNLPERWSSRTIHMPHVFSPLPQRGRGERKPGSTPPPASAPLIRRCRRLYRRSVAAVCAAVRPR
ncbi:hypothetical protein EPAKOI_000599 [Cupriavidus sp. H18C2]